MSVRFGEEGDRLCLWQHGQTYSIIVEYPCADRSQAEAALARLYAIMAMPPDWAPDLPLRGDGDVLDYYRKT